MPKPVHLVTSAGRDAFEVLSALQKAIRRGLEKEAGSYALELASTSKPLGSMVWNRLCVIAHEDIGIVNQEAIMFTQSSASFWTERHGRDGYRLAMMNVILVLCRSQKKTREGCHFTAVTKYGMLDSTTPLLDCALDMHTARGRKMGRGIDHFLDEGRVLNPPQEPDQYMEEAEILWRKHYEKERGVGQGVKQQQNALFGIASEEAE